MNTDSKANMLDDAAMEAIALRDYRLLEGKVILVTSAEGYERDGERTTIDFDPPMVARVQEGNGEVGRWMDDHVIDPVYYIDVLVPHHALRDDWVQFVYGPSVYRDDRSDTVGYELAPEHLQRRHGSLPALSSLEAGMSSGRSIQAEYRRMYTPHPGPGMVWEEEFDRIPFDATRSVLSLDLDGIHELEDAQEAADELAEGVEDLHPLDGPKGGGTDVFVIGAILDYFQVTSLKDIDQEMLDKARAAEGVKVDTPAPGP